LLETRNIATPILIHSMKFSALPVGFCKGDVKKKHYSLRIGGRVIFDIQPLAAAASSVPEP